MRRGDKRLAARGAKHVLEFEHPVGGVDVDQDQAGFCGGELNYDPLCAVGGPNTQAIPGFQAQCEKSRGQLVGVPVQLGVIPPDFLAKRDQSVAIPMGVGDSIEKGPDTEPDEGLACMAMNITKIRHGTIRV